MKRHSLAISIAGVLLVASCRQEPEVRRYREIVSGPPARSTQPSMPDDDIHRGIVVPDGDAELPAPAAGDLAWSAPAGWVEEAGRGMRLATLRPDGAEGDCTIVVLGGVAGGTEANITRWLGQLGVELSDEDLASFIAGAEELQSEGGLSGKFYDFTSLVGGEGDSAMLAGVFEIGRRTAFIKYTAQRNVLETHREGFLELCRSLGVSE